MTISTHVLDATSGGPAAGIAVTLFDAENRVCDQEATDADGRVGSFDHPVDTGVFRLRFDTGAYFRALGIQTFYPEVSITFLVGDLAAKYHVPLLLSPFAYSTYRGS